MQGLPQVPKDGPRVQPLRKQCLRERLDLAQQTAHLLGSDGLAPPGELNHRADLLPDGMEAGGGYPDGCQ